MTVQEEIQKLLSRLKGATPEQIKSIQDGNPAPGTPEQPSQISSTALSTPESLDQRIVVLETLFTDVSDQLNSLVEELKKISLATNTSSGAEINTLNEPENPPPQKSLPPHISPGGIATHSMHSSPGGLGGGGSHIPEPEPETEINPGEQMTEKLDASGE